MATLQLWSKSIKAIAASYTDAGVFRGRDCNLNDFLADILPKCNTAPEVAAQLAFYFSVEDGRDNGFRPGLVIATAFLFNDRITGNEQFVAQAGADLKSIMKDSPTLDKLLGWARSHDPEKP